MSRNRRIARLDDVPRGAGRAVTVDGQRIALYHGDNCFFATDDACSHADASLAEGRMRGDTVVCPLHGARFDLRTGAALSLPATEPIATYPVRVDGTDVLIEWEPRHA